jgi:hypothetical protein
MEHTEANDWYYCAQIINKVLPTHVIVHYYTTIVSVKERETRISQATFLKTWCLNREKGPATTIPPEGTKKIRDIRTA